MLPAVQISEALWADIKRAKLMQKLCYDDTNACEKKPPPLPKVRGHLLIHDIFLFNRSHDVCVGPSPWYQVQVP